MNFLPKTGSHYANPALVLSTFAVDRSMVGKVPGSSNFFFELIIHLASISFGDDVRHKTAIIHIISVTGLQMPF